MAQVSWLLELELDPARAGEFTALLREMVTATQTNEPGTLDYEWSAEPDGRTGYIFERYTDSDAVLVHLNTFGARYAERFLTLAKPTRCTVFGTPDERVRKALAGLKPEYAAPLGGFSR